MNRDSHWKNNPSLMMRRAHEIGRLVEHLNAEQTDGVWNEGTNMAVPVLLSLAVEIGLKAWHRSEGNKAPLKTHDLPDLFDRLGENTRKRIEDKMPEISSTIPDCPIRPGYKKRTVPKQENVRGVEICA